MKEKECVCVCAREREKERERERETEREREGESLYRHLQDIIIAFIRLCYTGTTSYQFDHFQVVSFRGTEPYACSEQRIRLHV